MLQRPRHPFVARILAVELEGDAGRPCAAAFQQQLSSSAHLLQQNCRVTLDMSAVAKVKADGALTCCSLPLDFQRVARDKASRPGL